jgi:hypothetical protein
MISKPENSVQVQPLLFAGYCMALQHVAPLMVPDALSVDVFLGAGCDRPSAMSNNDGRKT